MSRTARYANTERLTSIRRMMLISTENIVSSSGTACNRNILSIAVIFAHKKEDDIMATAKQLPSGTWRCLVYSHSEKLFDDNGKPIIDPKTGKQKEKRFYESFTSNLPGKKGKKDAERQADAFLIEKDHKRRPENLTVKEACEKYIKLKENVLSETTLRGYETIIKNNIADIAELPIRKLTQEDVQRWVNLISINLSPKTVRNIYGFFSSVMGIFLPDSTFRTQLPQRIEPEYYTPSDSDIMKLIRFIEGTELEKAVLLAAFGSLRRGEVCGLEKSDIKGNSIQVRKTRVRGRKGIIEKSPKTTQSCRHIILPEFVIRKFDNVEGRLIKMHPEDISKNFKRTLQQAGVPEFRFHDLRHYTASIMHAIGIPDQYIMKRGGWKSDKVLKRVYRNIIEEEDRKFIEKINSHFENMQHEMQHKSKKA